MKDEFNTPKTKSSRYYGELFKSDSVVQCTWKPKDSQTETYVRAFLEELGLIESKRRPTSLNSLELAMSDFLVAARYAYSRNGFISWPASNDHYSGKAYGISFMREVREALLAANFIELTQKSSRVDGLCRVYRLREDVSPCWLHFEHHGLGQCVIVRDSKDVWKYGKSEPKGKTLPRKNFLPKIEGLEAQVTTINKCLLAHPLQFWDGREFAWCRRIFNDGRLDVGGRLYGGWQTANEHERLCSLIDGESVSEIDLKASYPSIINLALGNPPLGPDPYSKIEFVKKDPSKRSWAKDLISSYISKKDAATQFPQGFREKHSLDKKERFTPLMEDIYNALPFLRGIHDLKVNWMFVESEIIISTLEDLALNDIPAYPVHDSLVCKTSDRDKIAQTLQEKAGQLLGGGIEMDISHLSEDDEIITYLAKQQRHQINSRPVFSFLDWGIDDDMEVLE